MSWGHFIHTPLLQCMSFLLADFVAKVFLHS